MINAYTFDVEYTIMINGIKMMPHPALSSNKTKRNKEVVIALTFELHCKSNSCLLLHFILSSYLKTLPVIKHPLMFCVGCTITKSILLTQSDMK